MKAIVTFSSIFMFVILPSFAFEEENKFIKKQNNAFLLIENNILSSLIDSTAKSLKAYVESNKKEKNLNKDDLTSFKIDKEKHQIIMQSQKGSQQIGFSKVLQGIVLINGKEFFIPERGKTSFFSLILSRAFASDKPLETKISLSVKDYFESDRYDLDRRFFTNQCQQKRKSLSNSRQSQFDREQKLADESLSIINQIEQNTSVQICKSPKQEKVLEVCETAKELVICLGKLALDYHTVKGRLDNLRNDDTIDDQSDHGQNKKDISSEAKKN